MGIPLCPVCSLAVSSEWERGSVHGNTERFLNMSFGLTKCPRCQSIVAEGHVDYGDIYRNYPLNSRRYDGFARLTLNSLLRRLRAAGVEPSHRILDYGCGNGLLVQHLRERGYRDVRGFDPYVTEYAAPLAVGSVYNVVIANDVIEHTHDPRGMLARLGDLLGPGGILYVGTADAEGISMDQLDRHRVALHQPFHRVLMTCESLIEIGRQANLSPTRSYRRSYMDTAWPFANYRFLDELSCVMGYSMDRCLGPEAQRAVATHPKLWFWGLAGAMFPSAYEPAVVFRKMVSG